MSERMSYGLAGEDFYCNRSTTHDVLKDVIARSEATWQSGSLFVLQRTFIAVLISPAAEFPRTIEKAAERRDGFPSDIRQPHFHLFGESAAKKGVPEFPMFALQRPHPSGLRPATFPKGEGFWVPLRRYAPPPHCGGEAFGTGCF